MGKNVKSAIFMVMVVLAFGIFLSACKKDEEETENTDQTATEETEDTEETEESEEESSADITTADFSDFSSSTQTVGNGTGKDDSDYTLDSIEDTEMDGYHRFEFTLSSDDEDELAEVEASLNSSGGYISVRLDRVTNDDTGIDYQGSVNINKEGVLKLYHQVTPVATEEVYQVGISEDTTFYLHGGEDMTVLLDVKYPGEGDTEVTVEDEMEFTDGDVELSETNTEGDVKFTGYSWSAPPGVIRFVWDSSSASGNIAPATSASYDADEDTVTVTFKGVSSDAVTGADGEFEADLAGSIDRVVGTRSGTTSTYVFYLTGAARYRIYRSTSPNQMIFEVQM